MPRDLYDVLQCPSSATPQDLRAAYLRLAKEHHPDAGGDEKTFAQISAAYNVLRDAESREFYDRTGDVPVGSVQEFVLLRVQALLAATVDIVVTDAYLRSSQGLASGDLRRHVVEHLRDIVANVEKAQADMSRAIAGLQQETDQDLSGSIRVCIDKLQLEGRRLRGPLDTARCALKHLAP